MENTANFYKYISWEVNVEGNTGLTTNNRGGNHCQKKKKKKGKKSERLDCYKCSS